MENQDHNQSFPNWSQTPKSDHKEDKIERELVGEDKEKIIDLMDYFQVIYRRKKIIVAVFFVVTIGVAIASLFLTQVYETETLIKVGQIKKNEIESLANIEAIFSSDLILAEIVKKLGLPVGTDLAGIAERFSIGMSGGSEFLSVKGRGNSAEKSVEMVMIIRDILIDRHQEIFSEAQKTIEIEVETIKKEQEKIQKDIEKNKTDILRLNEDIKKYEEEIEKRAYVNSEGQGRIVQSYINLLFESKKVKENKESYILELEQVLVDANNKLQQKKYEKTYETTLTSVEIWPIEPQTRIAPSRKKMVVTSTIPALFAGIIGAFMAEFNSQRKKRIV